MKRDHPPTPDAARLDELAAITPDDIERAKAQWRHDAPPRFRKLLDAKQVKTRGRKPAAT